MLSKELIRKYGIVYLDGNRYYDIDFNNKDLNFENTTPYYLNIDGEVFKDHVWKDLLLKVFNLLDSKCYKSNEYLLSLQVPWGRQTPFTNTVYSNHYQIRDGLYLNCNHTAQHSYMTILYLLSIYNIDLDKCKLIIKRTPKSEPKAIRDAEIKKNVLGFKKYLRDVERISDQSSQMIIKNLDVINNKFLTHTSYDNLFIIQGTQDLSNIISKTLKDMYNKGYPIKMINPIKQFLKFYFDYHKVVLADLIENQPNIFAV